MAEPWKPGDPIGAGPVYLPDSETKRLYGSECRRQIRAAYIESKAKYCLRGPTRQIRRERLSQQNEDLKDEIKAAAKRIAAQRKRSHDGG